MSDAGTVTPLGFTKLIVEDMDKMSTFYSAVCGFEEENRADDQIAGRAIREAYFRSDPPGTGTFTLTKFLKESRPIGINTVILGFVATNIVRFVNDAQAAGGKIIVPLQMRPEHGVKVAFVEDLEGNLIEVVELI
jgi:catechol 2,3-dioxygenase-like lactoylglutathione lyase family enzyme